jgi:hypothetical protein
MMSRNIIFVLMYNRHRFLDLILIVNVIKHEDENKTKLFP